MKNESLSTCTYCRIQCKPLRCSQCKSVFYCSKSCQKKHWKLHKKSCRLVTSSSCKNEGSTLDDSNTESTVSKAVKEKEAVTAAKELYSLLGNMDLQQATQHYHQVNDEIEKVKNDEGKSDMSTNIDESENEKEKDRVRQATFLETSQKEHERASTNSTNTTAVNEDDRTTFDEIQQLLKHQGEWDFMVEKLIYISCFAVTLTQPQESTIVIENLQQISIQTRTIGKRITIVDITHVASDTLLARIQLPSIITATSQEIMASMNLELNSNKTILTFRIMYNDGGQGTIDNILPESTLQLTPTHALQKLQCKSCHQFLVKNDAVIKEVYSLPQGHWDEITDYLTCFEGQATVDFSSAVNNICIRGNVLEDESVLVMNRHDLMGMSVLAIDGYGMDSEIMFEKEEEREKEVEDARSNSIIPPTKDDVTYRGEKEWKDTVGGATLTCNICCSTLGFASMVEPDSFRLLKHKLRAVSESTTSTTPGINHLKRSNCGAFIAKELVRYAESQAVFTFAVYPDQKPLNFVLLLRVLSWNTFISTKESNNEDRNIFQRAVKVIFEEQDMRILNASRMQSIEAMNDPALFQWGGVDLCCPPDAPFGTNHQVQTLEDKNANEIPDMANDKSSKQSPKASVNLYLPFDEWEELKCILLAKSKYFSEATSQATTIIKLGGKKDNGSHGRAKLSFLAM
ncbi:hypothetical protein CTEN210_00898 [Chaetoceros tenuissimus]|uniref:MYND-type domain-containing protein n=1 Tax=Chaetoceros tenuissimus TaxID=426638 RepID=A0AAD3CF10_9STRA|nr:hypothetical protein CTEN210_00898 [Chaetoceros tenuissimus]